MTRKSIEKTLFIVLLAVVLIAGLALAEKQKLTMENIKSPHQLQKILNAMDLEIDTLRALANELKTDMTAHTHGGITTGASSTSAASAITSTTVTEQVERTK